MCSFQSDSFKDLQKKYARVRKAYNDKEANMIALLKNKKIDQSKMEIYIRAFKSEKELELWGKKTLLIRNFCILKPILCARHRG
jgi:murein L,D-transpeptidase YafK